MSKIQMFEILNALQILLLPRIIDRPAKHRMGDEVQEFFKFALGVTREAGEVS